MTRREPWMDNATCAVDKIDPELFFPELGVTPKDVVRFALNICHRECPVQVECLDYSFRKNIWYGIFGGYTEIERWRLRHPDRRRRSA